MLSSEAQKNICDKNHMTNYIHPLNIGGVTLKNNIILAPMAGVTDLPFRLLCARYGSALQCMEMVSAKAIMYNNKNTEALLEIHPEEMPVSLQLFGSDPEIMAAQAKRIEERPFAVLDINMGCPVPKVVNNNEGSALMKDGRLVGRIVESIVKAIDKPVTVKIRKGFDDEHVNACEIAHIAQESGASAITVHGRTREQYYAGEADWDIIACVKQAVNIPVIGNGDVRCGKDAKRMLESTGCDGVAIGRAVRGNPFIFREVIHYLETGEELPPPDRDEKVAVILEHATLSMEYKGEYTAVREMRKHIGWYSSGIKGGSKLRGRINEMETMEDLKEVVKCFMA